MAGEELAKLRLAHPFQPFTMVTYDGRRLPVQKPYHLAVTLNRSRVLYELPDGDYLTLKPAAIATVEVHDAQGRGQAWTIDSGHPGLASE